MHWSPTHDTTYIFDTCAVEAARRVNGQTVGENMPYRRNTRISFTPAKKKMKKKIQKEKFSTINVKCDAMEEYIKYTLCLWITIYYEMQTVAFCEYFNVGIVRRTNTNASKHWRNRGKELTYRTAADSPEYCRVNEYRCHARHTNQLLAFDSL